MSDDAPEDHFYCLMGGENGDLALASFKAVSVEVGQSLERQMPGVDYAEIEPLLGFDEYCVPQSGSY